MNRDTDVAYTLRALAFRIRVATKRPDWEFATWTDGWTGSPRRMCVMAPTRAAVTASTRAADVSVPGEAGTYRLRLGTRHGPGHTWQLHTLSEALSAEETVRIATMWLSWKEDR